MKERVQQYRSLELGYFSTAKATRLQNKLDAAAAPKIGGVSLDGEDKGKATLKQAAKEIAALRSAAETQIHLTAMVYDDENYRIIQNTILAASMPTLTRHSSSNKLLRNICETAPFEIKQLNGDFAKYIVESMSVIRDRVVLADLTVRLDWSTAELRENEGG